MNKIKCVSALTSDNGKYYYLAEDVDKQFKLLECKIEERITDFKGKRMMTQTGQDRIDDIIWAFNLCNRWIKKAQRGELK